MSQIMDCSEARLSLGVYVLGAIDPAERSMVDSHLSGCRDCRDELAGLAGLPALLARVDTEEAIALAASSEPLPAEEEVHAPPERLLATVLDLTSARRRRRVWRDAAMGLAAALIIAAGVFGGLRVTGAPLAGSSPAQAWGSIGPVGPWQFAAGQSDDMTVTVKYRQAGWGTQLEAQVTGIPVGTTCEIWVIGSSGKRWVAGSWITDGAEGGVWYPASAALAAANVEKFVITVGKHGSITALS